MQTGHLDGNNHALQENDDGIADYRYGKTADTPRRKSVAVLEGKVLLQNGQKFVLDMKKDLGDENRVTLPHKEIFDALKVGDNLLVNDGNIILKNILKYAKLLLVKKEKLLWKNLILNNYI